MIISGMSTIPHVFGIAVFGQHIYWTDWVTRSVKRAGKYNGGNPVTLMEGLDARPMDIKIFSGERQNCEWKVPPIYWNIYLFTFVHIKEQFQFAILF